MRKKHRSENQMNKRITKKCIGALLASIILTAYPVLLGRSHTTNTMNNANTVWEEPSSSQEVVEQTRNSSHQTNDHNQLHETILLKIKE